MSTDWKNYLITQGAIYKEDELHGFNKRPQILSDNVVSVLSDQSLMSVGGVDRQPFLQGQISTHMLQLAVFQHKTGVACSPKGRMYTNFRIMDNGEGYLMSMNKGLIESTLETLKKYAVFYKVQLAQMSDYVLLGLSGENIQEILSNSFPNVSLPINGEVVTVNESSYLIQVPGVRLRYELWTDQEKLPHVWPELVKNLTPVSEHFWQLLNIKSVIPQLSKETVDQYTPQHLNQPSLGGVSFKKGCYTGQEIITRMQNFGQQKSRCYWLTLEADEEPDVNARLYNREQKPVGEVIQRVRNIENNNVELLAVIRIDAAQADQVFLGVDPSYQLQVHPLPYAIDPKAELQN